MKKVRTICLILCICLLLSVPTVQAVDIGCRTTDANTALGGNEQIVATSKAVFIYERNSGTLIYSYNADEQVYPASMVKMMTALVALEHGDLDDICTVSSTALNSIAIGSVSAGLVRGEEISLRDLMYCMMVASANDAAAVIAEHIAGNQERFIELMNDKAAELGCTGTRFSNVTGLHDEQTYTTARDICKIIDAGFANEEFKAMFQTEVYTVEATNKSEARNLVTTNHMMSKEETPKYFDDRVTGGKTGATNQAGRCLAVSADIGNMELIAVVMGAQPTYEVAGISLSTYGSFEEMEELLDYVETTYEFRQIFYADQALQQYDVVNGANDVAVAPVDTLYCVLPIGADESELTWSFGSELNSLSAPVQAGDVLSTLQVWYNGICVAQTELVAMNGAAVYQPYTEPQKDQPVEQEESYGKIISIIGGVLAGLAVLVLVIWVVARILRIMARKAQTRRRRRNRRRNRNA